MAEPVQKAHLRRDLGFLHATSLAITDMVGIGPFITIPLFLATMGGPQAMLGWLVGAALAVSGTGLQALLRNPLADPYVLGVSSGAALGAIWALWVGGRVATAPPPVDFLGAARTLESLDLLMDVQGAGNDDDGHEREDRFELGQEIKAQFPFG